MALCVLVAGCGSSAGTLTVGAARTFKLAQFTPATFQPGRPQRISFTIEQPSGAPLTSYRTGPGPHTGVHLIIVRSDLGAIVHKHPPIGADGAHHRGGHAPDARPLPRRHRRLSQAERPPAELSALPLDHRRRQSGAEAAAAVPPDGHRRWLPLRAQPSSCIARDPGGISQPHRHTARREPREVHAMVRRAGACDLLPVGIARLLPHARLRCGNDRVHERARRRRALPEARPGRDSSASASCCPCLAPGGSSCRARWTGASSPLRLRWWCDDRSCSEDALAGSSPGRWSSS